MSIEEFEGFIQMLAFAKANPDQPWAAAFLAMWGLFNDLVEREWGQRIQDAGLQVPPSAVAWSFRGIFAAPMISTFMDLCMDQGVRRSATIITKIMPECISEMPVDRALLLSMLEHRTR